MTPLLWCVVGYLGIGMFLGLAHLSSGKQGEVGAIGTLIAHCLLWPLFVLAKK